MIASQAGPRSVTDRTALEACALQRGGTTGMARAGPSQQMVMPRLIEKSVIIHKDENGFGLRIKGQSPVYIEHVHEGGAAWRAGVRDLDSICKVNGVPVSQMDHKDVVLMFKSCSRFVALTLISPEHFLTSNSAGQQRELSQQASIISSLMSLHQRQYSINSNHRDQDFRTNPTSNDSTSLLCASNDYALDGSAWLLMDRTRSCRLTAGQHAQPLTVTNPLLQQAQPQVHLRPQGARAASSASMSALEGSRSCSTQQQKLNRRDSSEEKSGAADKRVAICACCQQQQCRNSADSPAELAHKHLIQRQLNMSLREPLLASKQQTCDHHSSKTLDQQQQAQSAATSSQNFDKSQTQVTRRNLGNIPQSMSSNSLPAVKNTNLGGMATETSKAEVANETNKTSQPSSTAKPRVVNKRIEIIREFIDTERTHTERLRCLDELFYRPLKQANFMSGEQLRMVFSCHRTLYKIHRQIYRILLSANFDIYSEPLVGSALLEIFEGDLKRRLERAACSFCSAQATNVELLNKLTRRDTKAGEFLAQVTSTRMIGRLGIKDLLASCFQRLTKYPLLLENLLKATPQMLPDDNDEHERERERERWVDPSSTPTGSQLSTSPVSPSRRANCGAKQPPAGSNNDDHDDETHTDEPDDQANDWKDSAGVCDEDEEARRRRLEAAEEARRNSRRMLAISLAEEREFIERALVQSRQILVRVNDSIRVSMSRNKLKEIWKRTDKYPGVPLIDITKQQVVHEGLLTLRLSKRSFDVYVLLLNDYIIILTREGQDKYRLKFFTPEGKSASAASSGGSGAGSGSAAGSAPASGQGQLASGAGGQSNLMPHQTVYSPVFVIDEHLTTRDAATDENGFYLLCKRKDDSRIYEFASRSPAERMKWRDKIQWTIEHQMSRSNRRHSCGSTLTKSSSEISANGLTGPDGTIIRPKRDELDTSDDSKSAKGQAEAAETKQEHQPAAPAPQSRSSSRSGCEPTKIVGTISYVIDDGIVMPNKMESSRVLVDQAIQVNILDGVKVSAARVHEHEPNERFNSNT